MTGTHGRRHRPASRPTVSKVELIIVGVGLVASVAAGVIAYRIVGPYGDGPFKIGYRRIHDPNTGQSLLVHESRTETGVVRRVIEGQTLKEVRFDADADGKDDTRALVTGTEVTRLDRDRNGDGRTDTWEYFDAKKQVVKVGFSLANDGVLDAWAYRDKAGQIVKVEVSTRRDDKIDRWEYYEKGQLARVEEDKDGDGRADRWSTYDQGILMGTTLDADKDGRPDSPGGP